MRPIDLVTIVPKSQDASQLQANQMTRNEQAQAHIGEQFVRQIEREREQTTKLDKSEKDEYSCDAREESKPGKKVGKDRVEERKANQVWGPTGILTSRFSRVPPSNNSQSIIWEVGGWEKECRV